MNTDTPRTDAATLTVEQRLRYLNGSSLCDMVRADFARQLERELNEAKAALEMGQRNCDEVYGDLQAERDAWRKVADALAEMMQANHQTNCSIQDPEEPRCDCGFQQGYEQALAAYEKLKAESK